MSKGALWREIQVPGQVGVHDFGVPLINCPADVPDRIERASLRTVAIRRLIEVRFENRFEHQRRRGFHDPVSDSWNTKRSLANAPELRNHPPSDRLRLVACCPDLLSEFTEPAVHAICVDVAKGFPVHTRRAAI